MRFSETGETLVEVVMALGILSLVLVSSYALATSTFRLGRDGGERTQAVNYLQEQAEALRMYRDTTSWQDFSNKLANYAGGQGGLYFCMVKQASQNNWAPVTDQANDCQTGVYKLQIMAKASDPHPELAVDNLPQQYTFTIQATWPGARQQNSTSITTTLVDQQ